MIKPLEINALIIMLCGEKAQLLRLLNSTYLKPHK